MAYIAAWRASFAALASVRACKDFPQPPSFPRIGPDGPQAARRNLPRANPAAQHPVPELVRRHLKQSSEVRQPPLVAIELPCPNPPPGQLATRQQLSHRRARVALPRSRRAISFHVELHRDLLDRPTLLTHLDDSIHQLTVTAQRFVARDRANDLVAGRDTAPPRNHHF